MLHPHWTLWLGFRGTERRWTGGATAARLGPAHSGHPTRPHSLTFHYFSSSSNCQLAKSNRGNNNNNNKFIITKRGDGWGGKGWRRAGGGPGGEVIWWLVAETLQLLNCIQLWLHRMLYSIQFFFWKPRPSGQYPSLHFNFELFPTSFRSILPDLSPVLFSSFASLNLKRLIPFWLAGGQLVSQLTWITDICQKQPTRCTHKSNNASQYDARIGGRASLGTSSVSPILTPPLPPSSPPSLPLSHYQMK